MANTYAPFGFRQYSGTGSAPTYEQVAMKIKSDYTTKVFFGDAVIPVSTGYIQRATASTVQLAGIFMGCKYLSVSQKRPVWSNYWPGADNNGDVEAYVCNDPNAKFIVQAKSDTNVTQLDVNANIQLSDGSDVTADGGNTATGISYMGVTAPNTTATLPFKVVSLVTDPPGSNGTDISANGNYVIVAFNNTASRANGAGPVGI